MPRTDGRNDRIRDHTSPEVNRRIDEEAEASLMFHARQGHRDITRRIEALDREWDAERVLMTNASTLALTGLILGATVNRRWLVVPGLVLPFLLQHAVQGWCPPLPVLRRLFRVRTRKEIDQERYALKALRGDFRGLGSDSPGLRGRVERAFEATRQRLPGGGGAARAGTGS